MIYHHRNNKNVNWRCPKNRNFILIESSLDWISTSILHWNTDIPVNYSGSTLRLSNFALAISLINDIQTCRVIRCPFGQSLLKTWDLQFRKKTPPFFLQSEHFSLLQRVWAVLRLSKFFRQEKAGFTEPLPDPFRVG